MPDKLRLLKYSKLSIKYKQAYTIFFTWKRLCEFFCLSFDLWAFVVEVKDSTDWLTYDGYDSLSDALNLGPSRTSLGPQKFKETSLCPKRPHKDLRNEIPTNLIKLITCSIKQLPKLHHKLINQSILIDLHWTHNYHYLIANRFSSLQLVCSGLFDF